MTFVPDRRTHELTQVIVGWEAGAKNEHRVFSATQFDELVKFMRGEGSKLMKKLKLLAIVDFADGNCLIHTFPMEATRKEVKLLIDAESHAGRGNIIAVGGKLALEVMVMKPKSK